MNFILVKKYNLFLFLLMQWAFSFGFAKEDEKPIQVSIITCGTSTPLYTRFGHTAIRIKNENKNSDLCYNYGTFNFDDPRLYSKLLDGRMNYFLSVSNFSSFYKSYEEEERSVYEQVLNLSTKETQRLLDFLHENLEKENRYYQYDFARNNCTTRVLELLKNVLDKNRLMIAVQMKNTTIREVINKHIIDDFELLLGINVLFGKSADKPILAEQGVFLPQNLFEFLKKSTLVRQENILLESNQIGNKKENNLKYLIWCLCGLTAFYLLTKKESRNNKFQVAIRFAFATYLVAFGVVGLFLIYMDTFTFHWVVEWNVNLLLFNPLLLFSPFWRNRKWYQVTLLIFQAVFLIYYLLMNQVYLFSILPIALIGVLLVVDSYVVRRGKLRMIKKSK